MNIRQLQHILVLAEKLNFTQAAAKMNIVQPALSRQVKQLEEELGVDLFKRNKRNVILTSAGQYFVQEIEKVLGQLERVQTRTRQIHQGEAGEIRIGFTHSVMQTILPGLLKNIRRQLPGVKTILREMNNRDQVNALELGTMDIGFGTNPLVPPTLSRKVLHVDNFVVLLPADHPIDSERFRDFGVFSKEDFIFPPLMDGSNYVHTIKSICMDAGFSPNVLHETDSASTAFRLVEAGMGICLEPLSSLRGHQFAIKSIELESIPQKAELTMMWHPDRAKTYPQLFELLKN